jgi:integrase
VQLRAARPGSDQGAVNGPGGLVVFGAKCPMRLPVLSRNSTFRRTGELSSGGAGSGSTLKESACTTPRHTCVSLLLDLGVPPHVVREIVGHSDIEVTMTIYGHAALDEKRKALRKPGEALG